MYGVSSHLHRRNLHFYQIQTCRYDKKRYTSPLENTPEKNIQLVWHYHYNIMKTFFQDLWQHLDRHISANSPDTSFTETSKRVIMFSGNTQMMGLYSLLAQASALCLMLGASRIVVPCTTLTEQSSSARLQASLQTRFASIIWRR